MIIQGVDTSALPALFEGHVQGRTLIMDGDGPAYRAAATVKKLDTAIRRFQQDMLTQMFLSNSESIRIHLTSSRSLKAGRGQIEAQRPYQGNRKGKSKPALLEPLREALVRSEHWLREFDFVHLHFDIEADDAIMQDSYRLKDDGVVWSDDKDLRMTPYPYFEKSTGLVMPGEPEGVLRLTYTPAGTPKCEGQGPLFFWAQMVMGDSADNVQGLLSLQGKRCGPVAAYELLQGMTQTQAANTVLDAYREIDQNPLPEGWLMWLLRSPGDNFWRYLQELKLSDENRRFLDDCVSRRWFNNEDRSTE